MAALTLTLGCGSGSSAETRGVPSGILPEDATFSYYSVDADQSQLTIVLSRTNLCKRDAVPAGTDYVSVNVRVAKGARVEPGTYSVETGAAQVVLGKTSGTDCQSGVGDGANRGSVVITRVTSSAVEGSFDGLNPDTKIHLQGTFIAKPCPDAASQCLLP